VRHTDYHVWHYLLTFSWKMRWCRGVEYSYIDRCPFFRLLCGFGEHQCPVTPDAMQVAAVVGGTKAELSGGWVRRPPQREGLLKKQKKTSDRWVLSVCVSARTLETHRRTHERSTEEHTPVAARRARASSHSADSHAASCTTRCNHSACTTPVPCACGYL
jgi:hypothetical protein